MVLSLPYASPSYDDFTPSLMSLYPRSKKLTDCDSSNSDADECQKPESSSGLTIGLAIGIPVALIIMILGFFLLRNYRKDKKEEKEHDPDFDENGEATALPDFPAQKYTMEDPFDNRNSVRFPQPPNYNANIDDKSRSSISNSIKDDPYIDNFVLPYHHQTGSKLSLDEYAKNLGSNPAYVNGTPAFEARTRNSSISNLGLNVKQNHSPAKSNLKTELVNANSSPTKSLKKHDLKYTNIPNFSTNSFNTDNYYNGGEKQSSMTDEDYEDSSDQSGAQLSNNEKFNINYENESELAINKSIVSEKKYTKESIVDTVSDDSYDTTNDNLGNGKHPDPTIIDNQDNLHRLEQESISQNTNNNNSNKKFINSLNVDSKSNVPAPNLDMGVESPFEDKFTINNIESPQTANNLIKDHYSPDVDLKSSPVVKNEEQIDGDFDFSNGNIESDTSKELRTSESMNRAPRPRSPRVSQFNLLKNDSDDEDNLDDDDDNKPSMSPEQDEELKRMKSVYKVYFDREQSIKQKKYNPKDDELDTEFEDKYDFKPDLNQPLPAANFDNLRINKDLKTDTNYDKRMTTTSSIYTETPIFSNEEQQYFYSQQQFINSSENYSQQQQPQFQQPPPQQQQFQQPAQPLPPLQNLPSASDIRKSTIQTYTDFQPRGKNLVTSPTGRQPFVPIENDGVWTSPITSPTNASQSTFGIQSNANLGYAQQYQQPGMPKPVPSASQLARSSVVMLNPVNEITKLRKFKPAGSLPNSQSNQNLNHNQNYNPNYNQNSQFLQHESAKPENDLIPGNRKSDVRRMMNTNF